MKTDILYLTLKNQRYIAKQVADVLKKGAVCIIPTDTIYGIVALDHIKEAVDRIYHIKKRPSHKPLLKLIGNDALLPMFTDQELPEELKKNWPGPLTVIFRAKKGGTIALRYPCDSFLKELFTHLSYDVLAAPSANLSGKDELFNCEELIETFRGRVELIVCAVEKTIGKKASTIVDISVPGKYKIVRQGEIRIRW